MSDAVKPPGGGNTKYVVGGLVLLAGAIAVMVMLSNGSESPPEPAPPPAPETVERVNPLAEPEFIIEDAEQEEDAGEPAEAATPEPEKTNAPARRRDRWDCAGDLDVPALQALVRKHRAQMRVCYERRLKVNNLLQGDVTLKIKVGSAGKVTATSASGSLNDPEVTKCMERQARAWTMAAPTGGNCAVVEIPFQFSPQQ